MKFKPLEFVTNTFVGPSSTELAPPTHSETTNHDDAESPRVRFESPSSGSEAELDDSQFFQLRKDDHRTTRRHPQTKKTAQSPPKASGNRKAVATTRNSPASSASANPRTTAAAKTPSPDRSMANQISPPSTSTSVAANSASAETNDASPPPGKDANQEAVDVNYSRRNDEEAISDTSIHPAEKTPNTKQSNPSKSKKANEKASNATTNTSTSAVATSTTTPSSRGSVTPATPASGKPPKKRLSVYEQLTEDAQAASEQWKEDAEAALRFKKQIYKEKLKEIRDAEEDLNKRREHLARLRQAAAELQGLLQQDIEKKKAAVRFGSTLKRKAMRATQKALKDKEDAKANLKAKEAILKQALKEAKTKNQNHEDNDHDDGHRRAKKRRKVTPGNKRNSERTPTAKKSKSTPSADDWESSQDEEESSACQDNSSDSDADDSDWEGAPKRKAKTGKTTKDVHSDDDDNDNDGKLGESSDPARGRSLRQTRVRSSTWTCSKCTLDNHLDDHECAVCGAPRPGYIPDF